MMIIMQHNYTITKTVTFIKIINYKETAKPGVVEVEEAEVTLLHIYVQHIYIHTTHIHTYTHCCRIGTQRSS